MNWSPKTHLKVKTPARVIVELLDAPLVGDKDAHFDCFRTLDAGGPGSLVFCTPRFDVDVVQQVSHSTASIILCDETLKGRVGPKDGQAIIFVKNPKAAFSHVIREVVDFPVMSSHDPVSVGAGANIEDGVTFGPNVVIGSHVHIGAGSVIHANVVLYDDVQIGRRTVIHAGCVIGHPGVGPIGSADEGWEQFPDLGDVRIGDDVQIGANTCIARAPLTSTNIEDGVKVANMVNIGHNAHLRRNSVVTSMCMMARGELGEGVWLAPGVVLRPGVNIGANSMIGAGAVVVKDIPPNVIAFGNPAKVWKERS